MQAHHIEVTAIDDAGPNRPRLSKPDHREAERGELAKAGQCLDAFPEILDLGHGERGVLGAIAWSALADVDEPVFVGVDQRPE